jgi:hypothetical protein
MSRNWFSLGAITGVLLGLTGCFSRQTYIYSAADQQSADQQPSISTEQAANKQQNPKPKTQPQPDEGSQDLSNLMENYLVHGVFHDDFSVYDGTFYQGQDFGPWTAVYDGDGFIRVEAYSNAGAWLELQPALPGVPDTLAELTDQIRDSMSEEESRALTQAQLEKLIESRVTRSALVVTDQQFTPPFVYKSIITTEYQTKENPADKFNTTDEALLQKLKPNPWEVAWVVWNYIPDPDKNYDKDAFNYFMLKSNGWELGYRNSDGIQHILTTGDDVKLCTEDETNCNGPHFRDEYEVTVVQDEHDLMTIYVGGEEVTTYLDCDIPGGGIGYYTEDAGIGVAETTLMGCADNSQYCEMELELLSR